MTVFTAKVTAARAAFNAAEAARSTSKAATTAFYERVALMQDQGSDLLRTIRNYAITKNDPNVYVLAQIPPPATPGTTPPPGTPFDFRVVLEPTGSLAIGWKCNNPAGVSGTIYEVKRKIGTGAGAAAVYVGATGVRTFTDATVPSSAAASGVTYQITGVRSTSRGVTGQFVVNFGVPGGGGLTIESVMGATDESVATIGATGPTRLAA